MKLYIGLILLILIFLSLNNAAQQSLPINALSDTTLANEYFNKASILFDKAKYDSSIAYFQKASAIYEKENLIDKYVQVCNYIANNFAEKGEYEQSLSYLNKALQIGLDEFGEKNLLVADSYNNLGFVNYYQSNYDQALELYFKALSIYTEILGDKHPYIATSYNNIGMVFDEKGRIDQALEFYFKALSLKLEILGNKDPSFAPCYNNIGIIYNNKGDYDKALEFHYKALNIWIEKLGDKHPYVGMSNNNIGNVYYLKGNYDKALEYYNRSLEIKLETLGEVHPVVATSYNNIGMVYNKKGCNDQALEFYHKSLSIKLEILGNKHPQVAESYYNIGIAYKDKSDYDKALEYYNNALFIWLEIFGNKHPYIAKAYQAIGKVYSEQDNLAGAINAYQKSITALISDFDNNDIYNNPPLKNMNSEPVLLNSLEFKAETFTDLFLKQSHNIKDLKIAISTYELASKLIDKIRSGYTTEVSKISLAEQSYGIYNKAVETAFRIYQITGEETYKEKAFQFAEKNKVGILNEALVESQAKKFAGIPDSLIEKERQLKIDLSFYNKSLSKEQGKKEEADSLKINYLQDKLFTLNREYDDIITQFEKKYPAYYNLKYQLNTVSPREIQEKLLTEHSALIEYCLSDSSLFIFTITAEDFDLISTPIDSTFFLSINQFYGSIRKLETRDFLKYSSYLYSILIQPILGKIASAKKIIFIPDGILYYTPFEALVSEKGANDVNIDFTRLDYLIKNYIISYHYSSTLLSSITNRSMEFAGLSFVGFAPVFSENENYGYILSNNTGILDSTSLSFKALRSVTVDGKMFAELPMSQKEVSSIVTLFEKNKGIAEGYFHSKASEENFKSEACKDYRYVHIATHGLINEKNPKLSGLIFSQPKDTAFREDGILYSGETYNLSLDADLVILSSCESGIGPLIKGEGVMAIGRGFLYSGASNLIFSLWKVDDEPTSELMIEFYKNIFVQEDFAQALRTAKLRMIRNKYTAFPKNWSSFILIGN